MASQIPIRRDHDSWLVPCMVTLTVAVKFQRSIHQFQGRQGATSLRREPAAPLPGIPHALRTRKSRMRVKSESK
jgi:hypothetical protein